MSIHDEMNPEKYKGFGVNITPPKDSRTNAQVEADCNHPDSGCGCEYTGERKFDLEGNSWILQDSEDEGWIMEESKDFPMADQDGGEWETDADEDGSWSYFVPEFSAGSCPFCDKKLSIEVFDHDQNTAAVAAYCKNHEDGPFWFPAHDVAYESYDDGDTWVPYGDTYVKLT